MSKGASAVDRLRDLAVRWKTEADTLERRYADERAARLFRLHAVELEEAIREEEAEALTLQEASAESGFSADHLGRLLRDGKLPNAGRPHAPRIRRDRLPVKAGCAVANGEPGSHLSRTAIVRSVIKEGA